MRPINPKVLTWARQSASLTPAEAAKKASMAEGSLVSIERGDREPTRRQMQSMADAYRRSLLSLYLAEPPTTETSLPDLRTSKAAANPDSSKLHQLVRAERVRQGLLIDGLEAADELVELPWVGSMKVSDGVSALKTRLEKVLQFDLSRFRQGSSKSAFAYIREQAEAAGVYVLLATNLGNYHSTIGTEVFRGMCLPDRHAPVVVINSNDARSALSFTLLHELVHLLVGQAAISGYSAESKTERTCDTVASEMLVSDAELPDADDLEAADMDELAKIVDRVATEFNVSGSLIGYRLLKRGMISKEDWVNLADLSAQNWAKREKQKRAKNTGGNYHNDKSYKNGSKLIGAAGRLLRSDSLSTVKVAKLLGVTPNVVGQAIAER